jgi:hypothetical protein
MNRKEDNLEANRLEAKRSIYMRKKNQIIDLIKQEEVTKSLKIIDQLRNERNIIDEYVVKIIKVDIRDITRARN